MFSPENGTQDIIIEIYATTIVTMDLECYIKISIAKQQPEQNNKDGNCH